MIRTATIENFQKHRQLSLEFHPGVNVIVGPTDSGKSAILRALQWPLTNSPRGHSFVSHGEASAKVTLDVDGKEITRSRGAKVNHYSLGAEAFTAFGVKVPESIQEAVPVNLTNLSSQHEGTFMLASPPSEVTRQLADLADLSQLEEAHSFLRSAASVARARAKVGKERRERIERDLDMMAPLKGAGSLMAETRDVLDRRKEVFAQAGLLRDSARKLAKSNEDLRKLSKVEKWTAKFEESEDLREKAKLLRSRAAGLRKSLKKLKKPTPPPVHPDDLNEVILYQHLADLLRKEANSLVEFQRSQSRFSEAVKVCPVCGRTD